MNTTYQSDVGYVGRPRCGPRWDGWGVGCYYVATAHDPTPHVDPRTFSPRATAHVETA